MAATYTAGKAKRKDLAFFYKVAGEGSATYELIGKGIEDASISQSADVETVTDITGNSETTLSSYDCLLYTSPSPRDKRQSRMPSSA